MRVITGFPFWNGALVLRSSLIDIVFSGIETTWV
jgi:hypothetical protein